MSGHIEGLPSIRELEIQLQRMPEPSTDTERQAVRVARALLRYARNQGTPEYVPPTGNLAAQSLTVRSVGVPAHLLRPRQAVVMGAASAADLKRRPARPRHEPKPPMAPAPRVIPEGSKTARQLSLLCGFSVTYMSNLLGLGILPAADIPHEGSQPAYWSPPLVEQVLRIMADPKARRPPPKFSEPPPADWVSAEQFAQRMGYVNSNAIHRLVSIGKLPGHTETRGKRVYWKEQVVAACVASKAERCTLKPSETA